MRVAYMYELQLITKSRSVLKYDGFREAVSTPGLSGVSWLDFAFSFLSPALIFPSQVVNCLLSYHNYFDAAQVGVLRMHFQSDILRMQTKKFAIFITKLIVLFLNVIRTTSH